MFAGTLRPETANTSEKSFPGLANPVACYRKKTLQQAQNLPEFSPPTACRSSVGVSSMRECEFCVGLFLLGAHRRGLSGPNRAMQLRCAMRFDSNRTPPNRQRYEKVFFGNAEITGKCQKKKPSKILRCWPAMRKFGVVFKIKRCEMPAIRAPAASSSMEDWDAESSPCNLATTHFLQNKSGFISL